MDADPREHFVGGNVRRGQIGFQSGNDGSFIGSGSAANFPKFFKREQA